MAIAEGYTVAGPRGRLAPETFYTTRSRGDELRTGARSRVDLTQASSSRRHRDHPVPPLPNVSIAADGHRILPAFACKIRRPRLNANVGPTASRPWTPCRAERRADAGGGGRHLREGAELAPGVAVAPSGWAALAVSQNWSRAGGSPLGRQDSGPGACRTGASVQTASFGGSAESCPFFEKTRWPEGA